MEINIALLKKYFVIFFCFNLLVYGLSACSKKEEHHQQPSYHIITVAKQVQNQTLYLSGTIKPIDIVNVPSPVEGTVGKLYFHYGQRVKKGEVLLTVKSSKLMQQYQDALTGFLKAKDTYLNSKVKMEGTEDLYNSGLVSKNEYDQGRSELANNYLSFMQSKSKLDNILKSAKGYINVAEDLTKLSIEDLNQVQKALSVQLTELAIHSPTFGIILMPIKDNNGDGDSSAKILKPGSEVKENATLISIGDFTGLSVNVSINEININSIIPGQQVIVTGVAFPGITLKGKVNSIDVQAVNSQSGGLPTFPVTIVVPQLSKKERQTIHIGMSAQIQLVIKGEPAINIPIKAVEEKNGMAYVKKVISEKPLKTKDVMVTTGQPSIGNVVIKSGLNVGDKILVNN